MGIGAKIKKALRRVGSAISGAYKDVGKLLDKYVVKPIEKDPWGFIVTAAASSFGIPFIVGPGAIASGIASTAVNLAQGKDFNDALKAGVTAGVMDFGLSEGMNMLSNTPKPFGSSLGSVNKAPLFDSIFADAPTASAVDVASNNFKDTLSLDSGADDVTAAFKNDQMNVLNEPFNSNDLSLMDEGVDNMGSYLDEASGNPNQIETYLTPDDQLAFARNNDLYPYSDLTPDRIVSDAYPNNLPTDYSVSGNEIGGLYGDVPDVGAVHGIDAASEYWKPQAKSTGATHWWEDPVGSLGQYSKDMIGVDVTNPWIVGAGVMGLNYYEKKKAAEEEARRQAEARANDPANSPLFTAKLQQYEMRRKRNKYAGDINRYGQRNSGTQGEFGFYDPAVYVPVDSDPTIQAATGGQIRAPYYTYGNIPQYKAGGLSALSDGRSDDIPAVLSDGEYVMDAETVALLGNGSTDAGAKQLDRMRESLRKQKGKALSKGKFSPNAKSPLAYLQKRG